MIRSPETRVENLAATLIDHDHVAESSPQEITMQEPSKQKEHWWDFGMVLSDINNEDASVDLMNIKEGLMDRRVATLHRSMSRGMGFALVDLKLYGFGHFAKVESVDFFVCDLNDASQPYEFRKAGQLIGPKISPIVIPFPETKQILVIATGRLRLGDSRDPPVKGPYCELLDLPSEDNGGLYKCKAISTLWDDTYGYVGCTPNSTSHAVVGNRLYIQITAGQWNYNQRLFCFDIKTHEWTEVEERADCPFLEPLDRFWRYLNDISRDKLFVVHVDSSGSELMHFVGFTSLTDLSGKRYLGKLEHREYLERIVTALPELEKLLTDKYSDYIGGAGWVMRLLPDDDNLFCLFLWLLGSNVTEYLLACKFKLCEGQRQNSDVAAMDADNDIATLGESSYDCEILSHTLYENPFLTNRMPLYVFTPAANYGEFLSSSCTLTLVTAYACLSVFAFLIIILLTTQCSMIVSSCNQRWNVCRLVDMDFQRVLSLCYYWCCSSCWPRCSLQRVMLPKREGMLTLLYLTFLGSVTCGFGLISLNTPSFPAGSFT
ncbi:unnamed protein product [Linum tenue]|uniref:Uncharacterized protein n=1 Tax=Linum tenue TaxID=586396 RepID=A0AAV0J3R8_9ROSI|nr:unnamed protein product [Linum tenue]